MNTKEPKTVRVRIYKSRRKTKTKTGVRIDILYAYRHPEACSVNYNEKEVEAFDKIELIFAGKMNDKDKEYLTNKWRHKL
jgi:hypothetical protein